MACWPLLAAVVTCYLRHAQKSYPTLPHGYYWFVMFAVTVLIYEVLAIIICWIMVFCFLSFIPLFLGFKHLYAFLKVISPGITVTFFCGIFGSLLVISSILQLLNVSIVFGSIRGRSCVSSRNLFAAWCYLVVSLQLPGSEPIFACCREVITSMNWWKAVKMISAQ